MVVTPSFSYRQSKYVVTFQDPSTISDCILSTTLIEQTCNTQFLLSDTKEDIFSRVEALQRGEHREGSNGLRNNSGHEEQQNKLLRTPSKEVSILYQSTAEERISKDFSTTSSCRL